MYMYLHVCMYSMYVQVPKEARRRLSSFSSLDLIISSVLPAEPLPDSQPYAGIPYSTEDHGLTFYH